MNLKPIKRTLRNAGFVLDDFATHIDKKAWWLCTKGHSYKATVKNRTNNKSGCPFLQVKSH